jgi:hypothetical protein
MALVGLTAVAACGGEAVEVKAAAAAQAQVAAVRARGIASDGCMMP